MGEFLEIIKTARISLPVFEITTLIIALSVCLANRWTRCGLVAAYLYVYRWGWLFFAKQSTIFFGIYLLLGGLVATLAVIDMLTEARNH